jgi:hypothetical protein
MTGSAIKVFFLFKGKNRSVTFDQKLIFRIRLLR